MVSIPTERAQEENYEKHKEDILNSGYRFAVIYTDEIKYYKNKKEVYKDFPKLKPNAPLKIGGTSPLFIDIGEIKNLEYRLEKIRERKKDVDKSLSRLNKRKDRLSIIEQKLLAEEMKKIII
jgi:hypothetical protein